MGNLFTLNFWLNSRPGELTPVMQKVFIAFVVILLIVGIVLFVIKKNNQKSLYKNSWEKLINFSVANTIIGVLLLFFTYELIQFLSARFWFLLWFIEMMLWLFSIYKEISKIPKIKEEIAANKKIKQYIP